MKVLYDHQIFSYQKFGGISRYFYELITAMNKLGQVEVELPIKLSNNYYLINFDFVSAKEFMPQNSSRIPQLAMKLVNDFNSIISLRKGKFDIFHPTYYDNYFLSHLGKKPFVVTVYDMTHELFPETASKIDFTSDWKKKLLSRADHIISISHHTKKDLQEIYNIPANKISVTHLATSIDKVVPQKPAITLPEKFLLFVGKRGKYKNYIKFIEAVAPLLKDSEYHLVTLAGGAFTKEENQLLLQLGINEKVILIPNPSDPELAYCYKMASLFVYPSMYEGFGIPALEAFAMGCPTAVSNVGSFPEVCRDSAAYFDPSSVEDMQEKIVSVLNNRSLRDELIKKAFARNNDFSWEKTALETVNVYQKV